jgi:hypothetical protein
MPSDIPQRLYQGLRCRNRHTLVYADPAWQHLEHHAGDQNYPGASRTVLLNQDWLFSSEPDPSALEREFDDRAFSRITLRTVSCRFRGRTGIREAGRRSARIGVISHFHVTSPDIALSSNSNA